MLTIARDMTEPGRDSDKCLCSPSKAGLSTSATGTSESNTICFEPRLGGGDKDVSSGSCSAGGDDIGVIGVWICKKLDSFGYAIIFRAIGVARGDVEPPETCPDAGGVGGKYPFDIPFVARAGGDGALSMRNRCLMEVRETGRGGGADEVGSAEIGVGGKGRSGGGKGETARAWGIVGRSERGGSE